MSKQVLEKNNSPNVFDSFKSNSNLDKLQKFS